MTTDRVRAGAALGIVASGLLVATGCESVITMRVRVEVSDEVASAYDAAAPGALLLDPGPQFAPRLVLPLLCGDAGDRRYSFSHLGCRPDPDVTVRVWIVRAPDEWLASTDSEVAPCDLVLDEVGTPRFPIDAVRDPTDGDPQAEVAARWTSTPICGGDLRASLAIE